MNSEFPQNERAKMEAKLTALLLGELHADEVAKLSKAMEADPELAALYERLKVTIELVREVKPAAEEEALKLSAAKREKLLASFKTVTPKEFARPRRVMDWLVPMAACAAIVGVLATVVLLNVKPRSEFQQASAGRYWGAPLAASDVEQKKSNGETENYLYFQQSLGGGGDVPKEAPPAPTMTLGVVPGRKEDSLALRRGVAQEQVPAAPVLAPPASSTPIVLPAGQGGDALAAAGQRRAEGLNLNVAPWGGATHDFDASNRRLDYGNAVAPNESLNGGFEFRAGMVRSFSAEPGSVAATNRTLNGGQVALNDNAYENQTYYRMLSQAGGETRTGPHIIVESFDQLASDDSTAMVATDKVPALKDSPMAGRLFGSDSKVADNGESKTTLTKDDVGSQVYLRDNGAVASQSNSGGLQVWDSFGGTANPARGFSNRVTTGDAESLVGNLLVADGSGNTAGVTNSQALTSLQAFVGQNAYVAVANGGGGGGGGSQQNQQNSVLTTRANQAQAANASSFGGGGGGGFGGGGNGDFDGGRGGRGFRGGGQAVQNSGLVNGAQPSGAEKPVEIAAAANAPASLGSEQSSLKTKTFRVDPNTFYMSLQNVGAVDFGDVATNGPVVASSASSFKGASAPEASAGRGLRYVTGLETTTETQLAVREFLKSAGVDVEGKSVFFNDRQGTLTIRGTEDDLKLVEEAVNTLNIPAPEVTVKSKFAEVNQNDNKQLGFDWYLGNYVTNNKSIAASDGSQPLFQGSTSAANPEGTFPGAVLGGTAVRSPATERAKEIHQEDIDASQLIQDGKLLYQLGRNDEAEIKFQEALNRDPNNQAAHYYSSLNKQIKDLETVDAWNVTSMNRVIRVTNGWADNEARLKLPEAQISVAYDDPGPFIPTIQNSNGGIPLTGTLPLPRTRPRRGSSTNALIASAATRAFYDDNLLNDKAVTTMSGRAVTNTVDVVTVAQAKVDQLQKSLGVIQPVTGSPIVAMQEKDTALPKPTVPPPTPQPEVLTRENAFSTFSLNVSDVSFKLAGATLEKGQMPEPGSIRSEEFINAFDYRDPDAAPGAAIAFASERARYPFAHNRELLRFSLKTAAAGRQAGRPLNIVLLLDNSGSMERADRVNIIREALRVLAGQLHAGDTFSVVTFARTAQLRVDGIPGNQAGATAEEIAKLTPEGGTNLGDALALAYETARRHYLANGDNRVVLLTDGAANLGDVNPDALKQKVEAQRQQGIALDCFGIGWEGLNDDLLEVLTRNGDGRYGFINTPAEANTEFVAQIAGALHVAASDVKVQVEFNTNRVTSYRQIGYAKHQLTKEQFRDNKVDAAEITAQEAGNALYTIEINSAGSGSIATVRVRYKVPGTVEYREQAWDVPYTGGAMAMDQAAPAMRLAATACAFSEWLATSPFAAEVSTDELLRYMNGVPQFYGADARPAKLEWMIRQAKSVSGK